MSNLSKLLSRSGTLVQQGDLAGAQAELEKATRDHAQRAEPWISLAAVHGMSGNFTESLQCARKAVELSPDSLQAWMNLANAAQSTGNMPLAVEAMQRARCIPGCPDQVTLEMGMIFAQMEQWPQAESLLREHLSRNPGNRDAALTLSSVLAKLGKNDDGLALVEQFQRQQPHDINTLIQLGRMYCESGRIQDAWNCCDQAMKINPVNTDALFFRVELLEFEGRLNEAIDTLDQLGRLLPNNSRIYGYLSAISYGLGHPIDAIAYARAALKIDPNHVPALVQLSSVLLTIDAVEARQLMEQAERLAPTDPSVKTLKGQILEFEGDKQGAWECVRDAITSGSLDSAAAVIAAKAAPALGKFDETISLLEQLLERPGLSVKSHRTLHFALAQLCDKAKQFDRAFEHAIVANRLKYVRLDHNARQIKLNRLKAVYSEANKGSLPKSQNHSELPVFIVGMPRSGTSLLEQILSCHSKVSARGETNDVRTLSESIPYYPDAMRNLSQEKCDALSNAFIRKLSDMAPNALRVTDKLPANYMFLGLISQILPGAKIINCRRDPRDVCLSNFMIDFLSANDYAYDLESLALTCKDYQELIEHWKRVLNISILDVRYEDLISDPQTWVAKVLEFCGLEWEDACLNFHKSSRLVVTASYDQVRKPLYTSSVARWKPYERHLEPVSRILGLQGDGYP